ncbi:MAG: RIP metalloprotease RseP [Patescibacteria group bacterium]|nr:RIP metalloprotease RseP [Patescibacteria group bacterium]
MFFTLIVFIAVLSILVFAHELGHFLTAKKFGLDPEEFGFGFPPRALGIYKSKDGKWKQVRGGKEVDDAQGTIYSINWLPLGGFVKLGEDDEKIPENANHFHNKPIWQRTAILLAGVTMNVVLAAVFLSFGFMIGLPQVTEGLHSSAVVSEQKIQIISVLDETPASEADLKTGDTILNINGETFKNSEELQNYSNTQIGNILNYQIKRADKEMSLTITPERIEETEKGGIGIGIIDTGLVRYPVHIALWEGIKATVFMLGAILAAFYELLKGLVVESSVKAEVAGPVGIAVLTGQVARMGFVYILQFAAMLSINLAIINALPIPALDGGRVLFLLIEKLKGSPVKRETEGRIHYIGFALLVALILVVTFKDLVRVEAFQSLWQAIVG